MKKISFLILILLFAVLATSCGTSGNDDNNTGNNGGAKNWTIVKEATCTENGLKRLGEDENAKEEIIPALGHNFGEYETSFEPLCTEDGEKKRTCDRCGHTETELIDAKGHDISDKHFADKEHHWHQCNDCGEKFSEEEHTLGDFTEEAFSINLAPGSMNTSRYEIIDNYKYVYSYICEQCNAVIQEISVLDYLETYTDFELYYDDNYNLIQVIKSKNDPKKNQVQYDISYNDKGYIEYVRTGWNLYLRTYDDKGLLTTINELYGSPSKTPEEVISDNRIVKAYYYDYNDDGKLCYLKEDVLSFNKGPFYDNEAYDHSQEWTYHAMDWLTHIK